MTNENYTNSSFSFMLNLMHLTLIYKLKKTRCHLMEKSHFYSDQSLPVKINFTTYQNTNFSMLHTMQKKV